eukprot:TRINITY_DN11680_c0_g1_i1.p1 TRINITY_DN11680_c0_g1~~TRINITY_DN11680_c0_g1_i1.p1  ORF type:complete len:484 (-),score=115.84 TRINITY_DN11680_c0_g1_i1:79-1530(-)
MCKRAKGKRPELKVSIPCLSVIFLAIFVALLAVVTAVCLVLMMKSSDKQLDHVITQLQQSQNSYFIAEIQDILQSAVDVVTLNAANHRDGAFTVNPFDLYSFNSSVYRTMMHNEIVSHSQFEFINLNYKWADYSYGYLGFFGRDLFYYTDRQGTTHLHPVLADGSVQWSTETTSFYANVTNDVYITVPLTSPTHRGWTPVYSVDIEESTGIDIYVTYGEALFQQDNAGFSPVVWTVDINLKSLNLMLKHALPHKNANNDTDWLSFIIELPSGVLLSASNSVKLYEKDAEGNAVLVKANHCEDSLIRQAAEWVIPRVNGITTTTTTTTTIQRETVKINDQDYQFAYSLLFHQSAPNANLRWVIVQLVPSDSYTDEIKSSRNEAIGWSVGVAFMVFAVGFLLTWWIATRRFIIYDSVYNKVADEDANSVQSSSSSATTTTIESDANTNGAEMAVVKSSSSTNEEEEKEEQDTQDQDVNQSVSMTV